MSGWFRGVTPKAWEIMMETAAHPLDPELVDADLCWWIDGCLRGRLTLMPTYRTLMKRWGISEWKTRRLMTSQTPRMFLANFSREDTDEAEQWNAFLANFSQKPRKNLDTRVSKQTSRQQTPDKEDICQEENPPGCQTQRQPGGSSSSVPSETKPDDKQSKPRKRTTTSEEEGCPAEPSSRSSTTTPTPGVGPAASPSKSSASSTAWTHYLTYHPRKKNKPRGWTSTVKQHSTEEMINLIDWAETSPDERATMLREKKLHTSTPYRPDKAEEYLDNWVAPWVEAGRPDQQAPPPENSATNFRPRNQPPEPMHIRAARVLALHQAAVADAGDLDPDPQAADDQPPLALVVLPPDTHYGRPP